ncbi:MAG: Asp-tRNA(Asn)/Glu-tRNA(Gln) amidotransferase subunit GatC [Caldimicrobium sp.]|jgi:aspartyl-tRNA(Asn)/glutamyl-tRNA(Gln) amidotransferase subunit C|uniref:Aspartyl/glutamyl-tRNA(Asn/Gln) amidotransferase subunit C n=1 Tax=Caldimicrobium thiodismutans TaxID=1653476 RepID=A0A2N7PJK2_9BACT|nr:MAG: Asp-tRNA(Asn)/Glu-tRNA(Gln) amidotransferase GatCAB subunit C [Caldimicrobium thiodismutans]
MPITPDEVKKIAHLARLEFSEEELLAYTEELSKILDYFQELQEVDTSTIAPTFHPYKKKTPFREDEVETFENIEGLLKIAPELKDTLIVVPKVVKAP